MTERLFIIFSENCIRNFKYKKNLNINNFFFLTPNLETKFKNKFNFQINKIISEYNFKEKEEIITRSKTIIDKIDKENKIFKNNISLYKTIYHFLYIILNGLQYIDKIVPNNYEYVYFENQWKQNKNKDKILTLIANFYSEKKVGVFKIPQNENIKFKFLINLYNKHLINSSKNKEKFLYAATNYGFKNIFKLVYKRFDNVENFVLQRSTKNTFLSCIKNIINIYIFKNKNYKILYLIPDKKDIYQKNLKINNLINKILDKKTIIHSNNISLIVQNLNNYIENNIDQNFEILKKLNPKKFLCHHIRWGDNLITSSNLNKLNIPVYLISHGSHSINDNDIINKEVLIHLSDMLISPHANKLIIQSPITNHCLKNFDLNYSIFKSKPIMWAFKNFQNKTKNKKTFTILHASTTKVFSTRPFMYETSHEYLKGLKKLCEVIERIKNTKLIIRFRPTEEIDLHTVTKELSKYKNISIITGGDFIEDLNNSDLLVSYSSTTIEEALYLRKPVLLYGGSNDYIHISKKFRGNLANNGRNIIFHNNNNLFKLLSDIKHDFYNKPVLNSEINQYIYNTKNTDNYDFINNFIINNE